MFKARTFTLIILATFFIQFQLFAADKQSTTKTTAVTSTTSVQPKVATTTTVTQKPIPAGQRFVEELQKMEKGLNLTAEQQAKIKEIRYGIRSDIVNIVQDARQKIKDARIKGNDKIQSLLTEKQKQSFKEFRAKYGI